MSRIGCHYLSPPSKYQRSGLLQGGMALEGLEETRGNGSFDEHKQSPNLQPWLFIEHEGWQNRTYLNVNRMVCKDGPNRRQRGDGESEGS